MRPIRTVMALSLVLSGGYVAPVGAQYPLLATLDARAQTAGASVVASVALTVDRLMEESRRVRVHNGLKSDGYPGFLKVLRALPPIGTIRLASREIEVRYAHETPHADGRRVILVADRPLFFLAGDPARSRAGYELTLIELIIDADGGIVGTMAGAARVKPAPDGSPLLDDFAETPVRLSGRVRRP